MSCAHRVPLSDTYASPRSRLHLIKGPKARSSTNPSAYQAFSKENMGKLANENPGLSGSALMKIMGAKWQEHKASQKVVHERQRPAATVEDSSEHTVCEGDSIA